MQTYVTAVILLVHYTEGMYSERSNRTENQSTRHDQIAAVVQR